MPISIFGRTNLAVFRLTSTFLLAVSVTAAAQAACAPVPAPQRDITANSFYTDAHHSIVDPARHDQNVASVKPLEDFGRQIVKLADRRDGASHTCALNWLVHWAEGEAMLGTMSSEQAFFEREWMLAELSLAYGKLQAAAPPQQRRVIDAWLVRLAGEVMPHVDHKKGKRNNHYYWAGLAVAAAGRVTGHDEAIAWGRKVFDYAMGQIEEDGALPYEMDRAGRALNYHLFAAEPLVMLGAILPADSPKLAKLVQFCLTIIKDPDVITKNNGFQQKTIKPKSYDWLAVYARRHPSAEIDALLSHMSHKPAASRLGGLLIEANPLEENI